MPTDNQKQRAIILQKMIVQACIECGLNLTIYDGKIGFVDQDERKIIGLWSPDYRMNNK